MNQAAAQVELVTLLSDTLQQVSADRLAGAITQAWRDPYVTNRVFDTTSLVFAPPAYKYAVPTTMTTVAAIYLQRDSTSGPEEVSAELWEVINGQIVFNRKALNLIPAGALEVRGSYKLISTDTIPTSNQSLQNYVVTLAAWLILRGIGMTKILSFLHNDTSISEVIGFRREIEQDLIKYRAQLETAYVNN